MALRGPCRGLNFYLFNKMGLINSEPESTLGIDTEGNFHFICYMWKGVIYNIAAAYNSEGGRGNLGIQWRLILFVTG